MKGNSKPNGRKKKGTKSSGGQRHFFARYPIASLCAGLVLVGVLFFWLLFGFHGYSGPKRNIYIPPGATYGSVRDSLSSGLGMIAGNRTYLLWRLQGGTVESARGLYEVKTGDRALILSRRLRSGMQTPIMVSFNGVRSFGRVASRIASQFEFSDSAFLAAADSILPASGFGREQFVAAFLPDSYEFYITDSPAKVVTRLLAERNRFWSEERRARASQMGLTPVEVATVASIVEEESAKADERPKIARLYLNRLQRGMKLQADPTVKFAVGDFALRRILSRHLSVVSPYNTYIVSGLPPGPIRMPERRTLEGVLDAPQHNYIYMCAKEDFSGYHNFASDYAEHMANARRYHAELNRRRIK